MRYDNGGSGEYRVLYYSIYLGTFLKEREIDTDQEGREVGVVFGDLVRLLTLRF